MRRFSASSRPFLLFLPAATLAASLVLPGSPAGPTIVEAASFVVNDDGDGAANAADCTTPVAGACSLRDAIAAANAGGDDDEITFAPGLTDIVLDPAQGELGVLAAGALTIDGGVTGVTVSRDTSSLVEHRVFSVASGANLALIGITVTGGSFDLFGIGGGILNGGTLMLTNSSVSGSQAGEGGAIYNDGGTLTLTDSTVSLIAAGSGAIYNNGGIVTLTDSTVSGNEAGFDGGGIFNDGGTLTLTRVIISGNEAFTSGGGIFNQGGMVTLADSTVSRNLAGSSGGGITDRDGGTVTLTNSTVSLNRALSGGGIQSSDGAVTLTNSTISGNTAFNGGGLISNTGTVTLTNSTVSGNTATTTGGGIFVAGFTIDMGTLTLTNSTVSGNTSPEAGGIYNFTSNTTLTNSTVSGNSATELGGGILVEGGTVNLTNSTVSANTGTDTGGGGIAVNSGVVNLRNTIIANQLAGPDCVSDGGGFTAGADNLDSDGTCADASTGNAGLAPLGNYGGPTQTHALLSGSDAIDAAGQAVCDGLPDAFDQRGPGFPRTVDGDGDGTAVCDAGAFEFLALPLTVTKACVGDGEGFEAAFVLQVRDEGGATAGFGPIECGGSLSMPGLVSGAYTLTEIIAGPDADAFVTVIVCSDGTVSEGASATVSIGSAEVACVLINLFDLEGEGTVGEGVLDLIAFLVAEIDAGTDNTNVIGIDNDNTNNNANGNSNDNLNNNANENENNNENTNAQDQTNDQTQDNANGQTNTITSSPEVNIGWDE